MAPLPLAEFVLWYVSTGLFVVLALKLWRSGLSLKYTSFTVAALAVALLSLAAMPFTPGTFAYGLVWIISEPIILLLYVLVVLELYALVLRDYAGLATLSRRSLSVFVGLSIGISLLTLFPDLNHPETRSPWLVYVHILQRGVMTSLLVFLMFMLGFLAWYPVRVSRNTIVHSMVFVVFFLSRTISTFYLNVVGDEARRLVSLALLVINVACVSVWILALNPAGERVVVRTGLLVGEQNESRLIGKLDTLNTLLQRSARK